MVLTADEREVRRDAHVLTHGDIGDYGGPRAGDLHTIDRPTKLFIAEGEVEIGMNDHQLKLGEFLNRAGGEGTVIRRVVSDLRGRGIRLWKGLISRVLGEYRSS